MKRSALLAFATLIASGTAFAANLKPVKPIDGYKCVAIDAPENVQMDFQHPIPMKDVPDDAAPAFAPAPIILAVKETPEIRNGYIKSMNFAFRPGWVPTKWIRPYSEVHPGMLCAPYVMTDGKLGFKFTKE